MLLGPIGYKAIAWTNEGILSSPLVKALWPQSGITPDAVCHKYPSHKAPVMGCTCGYYASVDMKITIPYLQRTAGVLLLVEGTGIRQSSEQGGIRLHQKGFRAEQLCVQRVIDLPGLALTSRAAADYFDIDIVSPEAAAQAIALRWQQVITELTKEVVGA